MGMDRNSVIGFVLLGILLFIYLFLSTKNSHELEAQRRREADSIAFVKAKQAAAAKARDTATTSVLAADTLKGFAKAVAGSEHLVTVENELIKVVFSNKGGQPVSVELKQFKAYDSTPVKLIAPGTDNRLNYPISTAPSQSAYIAD